MSEDPGQRSPGTIEPSADRRSPGGGTAKLRLSVIVPVYDEADTVERLVRRVRAVGPDWEIVCVDDASTDGTRAVLEALERDRVIERLLAHEHNRGKGAAIRTAIPHATGDVVAVQDADLEYDPEELPRLLAPIADGRADAVFGSRFRGGEHRVLYFWHRLGNGVLTLFSNMLTDLNLTDMETCYKLVRRDLLQALPLTSDRFGFEPELTARLAQAGARIYELPISYHGRTYAEGKKIGWKDGVAAFWHILRANLLPPRAERYSGASREHGFGAPAAGSGAAAATGSAAGAAREPASSGEHAAAGADAPASDDDSGQDAG